jgi:hypothetical protein
LKRARTILFTVAVAALLSGLVVARYTGTVRWPENGSAAKSAVGSDMRAGGSIALPSNTLAKRPGDRAALSNPIPVGERRSVSPTYPQLYPSMSQAELPERKVGMPTEPPVAPTIMTEPAGHELFDFVAAEQTSQNLADFLSAHGLSLTDVDAAVDADDGMFDPPSEGIEYDPFSELPSHQSGQGEMAGPP